MGQIIKSVFLSVYVCMYVCMYVRVGAANPRHIHAEESQIHDTLRTHDVMH